MYDGDDVVLSFDGAGSLTHRYLHGDAVDQVFASEDVLGEVLWALTDYQGTVRDIADYDVPTDTLTFVDHRSFDSFGNVTSESNPSVEFRYAWTGRFFDADSGLQYNRGRWYDPQVGRWISEDPIGFAAGDGNLSRYVGNSPGNFVDPSGLAPPFSPSSGSAQSGPKPLDWFTHGPQFQPARPVHVARRVTHDERCHALISYGGINEMILVRPRDESTVEVKDATALLNLLRSLRAKGKTVDYILIKGHGNSDIPANGPAGGSPFIIVGNEVMMEAMPNSNAIRINGIQSNALLRAVTDNKSRICLEGCHTSELASAVSTQIGCRAKGSPSLAIGIPWTRFVLGVSYEYRNGQPTWKTQSGPENYISRRIDESRWMQHVRENPSWANWLSRKMQGP